MDITRNEISRLSQDLLVETITTNLRAITINLQPKEQVFIFYYEKQPTEDEVSLYNAVLKKISLIFTNTSVIGKKIVLPKPEPIPLRQFDQWIFCRYEKNASLFKIKTFYKEITKLNILMASQYALLGNIAENLRAISLESVGNDLSYFFFYDKDPNHEDKYLSDVIKSDVLWSIEGVSGSLKRFVLPEPEKIPSQEGHVLVYRRYEKEPLDSAHVNN